MERRNIEPQTKTLLVFTIAYNEEKKIGQVLNKTPKSISGIDKIIQIVVDDGSTDQTVKVAKQHNAKVYSNKTQKRLAYSFQKAIQIALELGADFAVGIDGDMQFNPEEITKLVKPIIDGKAEFVVGDRFTDPITKKQRKPTGMSAGKYLGNIVGSKIISMLSGQNFKDVTCGFRAYSRKAMLALNINSKYTYTQESFQVLAMKKFDILSIPISIKYFDGRRSRVVKSVFSFVVESGMNILKAFRDYSPLKFFAWLGALPFILGLGFSVFTLVHWAITGVPSPYKAVGIMGLYLVSLSLVIWIVGVMADMLDRVQNNQEKIMTLLKEIRFGKDNKD